MKPSKIFYTIVIMLIITAIASTTASAAPENNLTINTLKEGRDMGYNNFSTINMSVENIKAIDNMANNSCQVIKKRSIIKVQCPNNNISVSTDNTTKVDLNIDPPAYINYNKANDQTRTTQVRQTFGLTGNNKTIAIIDTGVDITNVELRVIGGLDVTGGNNYSDENGHGTLVASIAAAKGLNPDAIGAAPGAGIFSGKMFDKNGKGGFAGMTEIILYITRGPDNIFNSGDEPDIDVISASISSEPPFTYPKNCTGVLPDLEKAINESNYSGRRYKVS